MEPAVRKQITEELTSPAQNQGVPYPRISGYDPLNSYTFRGVAPRRFGGISSKLTDPSIKWEHAIIRGHPTHPVSTAFTMSCSSLLNLYDAEMQCPLHQHPQRSNQLP